MSVMCTEALEPPVLGGAGFSSSRWETDCSNFPAWHRKKPDKPITDSETWEEQLDHECGNQCFYP